jgi:hypothetical protein
MLQQERDVREQPALETQTLEPHRDDLVRKVVLPLIILIARGRASCLCIWNAEAKVACT